MSTATLPILNEHANNIAHSHPASIEPQRSPRFWHDEGNIILRIEDTLYRVHRGVLAAHLSVFNDMFAVPQPEATDVLEGCRIVALNFDVTTDWEIMLTFMYSPLDLNPWIDGLTSSQLFSIIRIAHKYQGDKLLSECISRLATDFPKTLDEYQEVYNFYWTPLHGKVRGRAPLASNTDELVGLINNALAFDIECILPCAYYRLMVQSSHEEISKLLSAEGAGLNPKARTALALGLYEHYPAILESVERWIGPDSGRTARDWAPWCSSPDAGLHRCDPNFDQIGERILPTLYVMGMKSRPTVDFMFSSWDEGSVLSDTLDGFCLWCRIKESAFRRERQLAFWDSLPAVFGMEKSWKDLKYNY